MGAGEGGCAPDPGRKDGLPLGLRSGSTATRRSRLPQPARCGRGVAARYAQTQGTAPSSRQDVDLGAETAPAAAEDRLRLLTFWARPPRACARARPCCPTARRTEPDRFACESAGAARRPGCARPPGGHRPSSPSLGWPLAPGGTPPGHPAQRGRKETSTRRTDIQKRTNAEPLGIRHRGAVLGETRQGKDSREANRWRAGWPRYINTA